MKRIKAAWRALRHPEPMTHHVTVTQDNVYLDGRAVIAAIRKDQRRRGQPPTV